MNAAVRHEKVEREGGVGDRRSRYLGPRSRIASTCPPGARARAPLAVRAEVRAPHAPQVLRTTHLRCMVRSAGHAARVPHEGTPTRGRGPLNRAGAIVRGYPLSRTRARETRARWSGTRGVLRTPGARVRAIPRHAEIAGARRRAQARVRAGDPPRDRARARARARGRMRVRSPRVPEIAGARARARTHARGRDGTHHEPRTTRDRRRVRVRVRVRVARAPRDRGRAMVRGVRRGAVVRRVSDAQRGSG
jgi:hypothetical protein